MSLETLLKATKNYLDREHRLSRALDILDPPQLRKELAAAEQKIQSEIRSAAKVIGHGGAIRNIMVAVDNSEPSDRAVERAVRLAEDLGARITIVHVLEQSPFPDPELAFYQTMARRALEDAAREVMHDKAKLVPRQLLSEELLREGNVAKQIVSAAEQFQADLLVIGTHSRGPIGRLLLGSTAEAVMRHAPCPVLTVGHPRQVAKQELQVDCGEEAISVQTI